MGEEEKSRPSKRHWQPIYHSVDHLPGGLAIKKHESMWENAKLEISTDGVTWNPVGGVGEVQIKGAWNDEQGQAGQAGTEIQEAVAERPITEI